MVKYSKLYLQEGTANYRILQWKSIEVSVSGYFYVNGFRFLVVRDPYMPKMFTVIEEKTGRRIVRFFYRRSVGAAYDVALALISEEIERLPLRVEVGTAMGDRVFHFRGVTASQSLLI